MVHATLEYLIHHNVGVIQTLFGVLFVLLIFLILRSFKEDSAPVKTVYVEKPSQSTKSETTAKAKTQLPEETSPLDDLDNLEELMGPDEKNNLTLDPSQPPPPKTENTESTSSGIAPEVKADLEKALTEKEKTISDLKNEIESLKQKMTEVASAAATAPAGSSSEGNGELETKLKELTEKLSEYEIIEEDIANLSFYKNENAKLKDELDKMKAGGAAVSLEPDAPAPEVAAPEVVASEALDTLNSTPPPETIDAPVASKDPGEVVPGDVVSAELETASTAPSEPVATVDSSVVDEFEQAVKQKEMLDQTMASKNTSNTEIDADILKEFENVVKKEWGGEPASAAPTAQATPDTGTVETSAPTPSVTSEPIVSEASSAAAALEDSAAPLEAAAATGDIDTSKLMNEVEALAEAPVSEQPSTPLSEEESKQKLIEEFESFINKAQ